MKDHEKIVLPGEVIGTSEEFLAGEGTFEQNGNIMASYLGKLNLDSEEMIAKVEPVNPLVTLNEGDIVLARVLDIKGSMVLVNIIKAEGYVRDISGDTFGSIHISKISEGYTSDVWKEYRIGDLIRAKVVQSKPSVQLSTDEPRQGVLLGLCTKCRSALVKKEVGLYCENCERTELRKTSADYGNYRL